jgi:polar amino acid transport system substrate-binding protein
MRILVFSLLVIKVLFAVETNPVVINVSYEDKATYPYYLGEGKKIDFSHPGVAIEAMQSVQKKLNIKFNFIREPGVRGQKRLQYNKTDMLLFASYKKSREKLGVFPKTKDGNVDTSKKAMELSYFLYTLKDSNLSWNGKKFINLNGKIGTTKGYSIVKFLKQRGVSVSENKSNLGDPKKLIAHRIVGFANQDCKIDPYLKADPKLASKIKKIYPPLKSKPYYMLFSHKFYEAHKKLVNKIWEELKNIDKFKDIRKKY